MKLLENKFLAIILMALTIFIVMVPIGHNSMWTALVTILVMLVVFILIDVVATFLPKTLGKLISIVIASVAIVAIGLSNNALNMETTIESEKEVTSIPILEEDEGLTDEGYTLAESDHSESHDAELRSEAIESAGNYVSDENYSMAIAILENALKRLPDDAELVEKLNEYTVAYNKILRSDAIARAEDLALSAEFENAALVIETAIEEFGDDDELFSLYKTYTALAAVQLPDWYVFEEVVVKGNQVCFSRKDSVIWDTSTYSSSVTVFSADDNGILYDVRSFEIFDSNILAKRHCAELNVYQRDGETNGFGLHEGDAEFLCYNNVIVEVYSKSFINSKWPPTLAGVIEYYKGIELKGGGRWPVTYLD